MIVLFDRPVDVDCPGIPISGHPIKQILIAGKEDYIMSPKALLIGNSDGIGLATTYELLKNGWQVIGISKSESPTKHTFYEHIVVDVLDNNYIIQLKSILSKEKYFDLCIYYPGIGELLDPSNLEYDIKTFDVNLSGMIKTASVIIPSMVLAGTGHFIGLSSVADVMLSAKAPAYHASKAAFSSYLESMALALKPKGVCITNVRFGFVKTKMAKGDVKPFIMSTKKAALHILKCIEKKPVRYTAPRIVIPLVQFRRWILKLKTM